VRSARGCHAEEHSMQIQTEVTFHGVDHSDSAEAAVFRWVARIEHLHDRMTRCHVTIGQPHHRRRHGDPFDVRVVVDVPGIEVVAHAVREDVYIAIADAFRAIRRQLQDQIGLRRESVPLNGLRTTRVVRA
jgi:ribosomal subunit interface protein